MAYFLRKGTFQTLVYIYQYDSSTRKYVCIPRHRTRHLDGQPDTNIDAWIRQNIDVDRIDDARLLWTNDRLTRLLESFEKFLQAEGKARATIVQHMHFLREAIVPYYLLYLPTPTPDPNDWPTASLRLRDYLIEREFTSAQITRTNITFRVFFRYLQDNGDVLPNLVLRLRGVLRTKAATPLKLTLDPARVLAYVQMAEVPDDLKFIALCGYFCSLRPQEIFALEKRDFRAGQGAKELECAKSMRRAGLYDGLAVKLSRQRNSYDQVTDLKTKASEAWVSCFDREAAQLLANLVNNLHVKTGRLLTKHGPRYFYAQWEKLGMADLTIKDLRRASLYYLGHNSKLSPIELMKHARHARIETTTLYLRRPDEHLDEDADQLLLVD